MWFVCLVVLVVLAPPGWAQGPAAKDLDSLQRQRNQIILQEEERRRREGLKLREPTLPESLRPPQSESEEAADEGGPCFVFQDIRLAGVTRLTDAEQETLLEQDMGACLSLADINRLLKAITNVYIAKGYVLARAYLQSQDLSQGILEIVVFEGEIEDIEMFHNGERRRPALQNVFPGLTGEVLNIRDLEQGLDQIHRLRFHDGTITMEPGTKAGKTRIRVAVNRDRWVAGSLAVDNSGLSSTGEELWEGTAAGYDLFGAYESVSVTVKRTLGNPTGKRSQSVSGYLSLPYGYWTFLWSSHHFEYETTVAGLNQRFASSGTNTTHTAEINRVLHRDDRGKTVLAAFLTSKTIRNFVAETLLVTGSRRLTIGGGRLAHVRQAFGGLANVSVTGEWGLSILGALRDEDATEGAPRAQFTKWSVELSYVHAWPVWGQRLTVSVNGRGQWSPHTLYASERINPGGQYTVRGFRNVGLNGDVGAYLRNELAWTLPLPTSPWVQSAFGPVEAFVGFDVGWLATDRRDPRERGQVAGWAIGLRARSGHLFGEAIFEKRLAAPAFLEQEAEIVRFQAGVSLQGLLLAVQQPARWIGLLT
ncbi:MAG: ShlB/FhaC/HecB family hemolysin secretion/activation protein [Pseudomonadales bacterium]|nr:ShlB/FhaC/HecB family hemolysin secretion/activation protein [Pseudomonadales bacterium]